MINPISVGQTIEYSLKNDTENPTIWIIGPLDSITKGKMVSQYGKIEVKDGKPVYIEKDIDAAMNNFNIVRYGLKGFKNYKLNGVDVEFKTKKEKLFDHEVDVVDDETLKCIPLFAIAELANVIWGENEVSEALRKN